MDKYRELAERIRRLNGDGRPGVYLTQGIVENVQGVTCDVRIGNIVVPGVRLKASETEDSNKILIVPKKGSAVIVGSLTGDLSEMVVLHVDKVESITINGGKLGGLINIDQLTAKINELVTLFNTHTHSSPQGTTGVPLKSARSFSKDDYEDKKIIH